MHAALAALVRRSPELVLAQDRDGWLGLFADDGVVEDPVGSAPHARRPGAGADCPLARFWATFIAGNRIAFDVHGDFAGEDEMLRDVTIRTRLSTGQDLRVPAYLLYQATPTPAGLRIARLRAIWDVRANVRDTLLGDRRGLVTLGAMGARLLRNQGLRGSLGYSRGLVRGIFGRGPARLEALARRVRAAEDVADVFEPRAAVELPAGKPSAVDAWLAAVGPEAALSFERPLAAGWLTAARFALRGAETAAGVAVSEFEPATARIRRLRFFTAPAE
jgi:hypothetical protein